LTVKDAWNKLAAVAFHLQNMAAFNKKFLVHLPINYMG